MHRRDEFRASQMMVDPRARPRTCGSSRRTPSRTSSASRRTGHGVELRNAITGEERIEEAAGFFVAIGHDPNTGVFLDWSSTTRRATSSRARLDATKVEGVFAAGDVQDHNYRQAVTAAGSGCMAALDAERWITARARDAVAAG